MVPGSISEDDQFIAACARVTRPMPGASYPAARPARALTEPQLRLLPELAAEGCGEAVRLMVKLGWPIAARVATGSFGPEPGGVSGRRGLTRFLLDHGASWKEKHGHGDNAFGTLSWASCNEP